MTATPMTPSAPPIPENPPRVLIVRAGLARLLPSICPEEAKILYQGFERASEIKALGAIITHRVYQLSFEQDKTGVRLDFGNGEIVHGDILVGVDGAHSSVRQHLYKIMDEQGLFPKADTESMKKGYISIPGTTDKIDPALYPSLNEHDSKGSFIIDTNPLSFRGSDWASDSAQKLMDEAYHCKIPNGALVDLYDKAPKDRICEVFYEDKLFET
ncbi:hypothetical protein BGX23_007237 [Mortierella sp. AD031]|nr:hypothetical protein BGX23_007237 [Mortierella sp. AD031]